MSKRSNLLQRVVTYIAEQLAPRGAKVVESALVPEKAHPEVLREVDTLIELDGGLSTVRIAVETRDRKRPASIQWVDELIGKYGHLAVDRVVAVSTSGFSSSARKKADLHDIHLLVPEEVEETDWNATFRRLGFVGLSPSFGPVFMTLVTTPPLTAPPLASDILRVSVGELLTECRVGDFYEDLKVQALKDARAHFDATLQTLYETKSDLDKLAIFERSLDVQRGVLVHQGETLSVSRIDVSVHIRIRYEDAPTTHKKLGDRSVLSSAQIGEYRVVAAQVQGAETGQVFVDKLAPNSKI